MAPTTQKKQAHLRHARVYLEHLKKWRFEIGTLKCPDRLHEIEKATNNISSAFGRALDPDQLDSPEMTRDFAILLFDYYDKRSGWDQWEYFGSPGLTACKRLNDAYSMGEVYPAICNCFGIVRRMQGKNDEAMLFYEQALEKAIRDEVKSDALTNMADIYRLQGHTEMALQCAQQAIELGQRAGDRYREAKGLEYLGLTYTSLREYDEAIGSYKKALQLHEEVGNLPRVALSLTSLSNALIERDKKEDLNQGIAYFRRAYQINIQIGNWQGVASTWGGFALIYTKLGEYQKAIDNIEQALDRNERIGFQRGAALNQVRLAENYLNLSNFEMALFYSEQACKNLQHLTPFDRKMALAGFSGVLLDLGRYMQNCSKLTEAIAYVKLATELAIEAKANDMQQAAMYLLHQLEPHVG